MTTLNHTVIFSRQILQNSVKDCCIKLGYKTSNKLTFQWIDTRQITQFIMVQMTLEYESVVWSTLISKYSPTQKFTTLIQWRPVVSE